jgi:hypothetical protein
MKNLFGFSQLEEARSWVYVARNITSCNLYVDSGTTKYVKSSQVNNTLPKAKSETRSKQNKDMRKCSSVYSERGVPQTVLTSGGE